MAGRSMTRNGRAGVFQISEQRYACVRKIKGSPTFLVEECYPCDDAPSGWYSSGRPSYIEAPSELVAAGTFSDMCAAGEIALL
jgi:hypothetical protein